MRARIRLNPALGAGLLALALLTPRPVDASVTAFTDKYIESIAARLKLPPGGPDAPLPDGLEARLAELEGVMAGQAAAHADLGPSTELLKERSAAFREAFAELHALPLDEAERALLAAHGAGALTDEKSAIFQRASAPFAAMSEAFTEYFSAYDRFQRSAIHGRILGMALDTLHRRKQLHGKVSPRQARRLDERIEKYLEGEHTYRRFLAHPRAKNHHKILATLVCQRRLSTLDEKLDAHFRVLGELPKRTFRDRLRSFGEDLKVGWRAAKAGVKALPGLAQAMAYLYNPFKKNPEPAQVSRILRKVAGGYTSATGMDLKVKGAEALPEDRPMIFAFSHRSELEDAIAMFGTTPGEYAFMVGQWALPGFLNDRLVKEPSIINVNGKKPDGTQVDALEEGLKNLQAGRNLVIFPEGMTPSDQGETQPLRRGLDLLADRMGAAPFAIVAVTLDDPANGHQGLPHRSLEGGLEVDVSFSRPIDPLVLRAVPGIDGALMRDLVRSTWHAHLYDLDVGLRPAGDAGATE